MTLTTIDPAVSTSTSAVGAPVEVPAAAASTRRERRLAGAEPSAVTPEPKDSTTDSGPRPKRRRAPLSASRGVAAWVLASVSLLCLWFVAYAVLLTPIQESHEQSVLYSKLREQLALQTAPLGGAIAPGAPVALISAPGLGIADVVVVEGTSSGDLMAGPGHRSDTVLPGQAGISVLFGRQTLFGGPFRSVASARPGQTITVTTGQGVFVYTVMGVRRSGDPLPVPVKSGEGRLVLVTSQGSGKASSIAPSATVYVDASLRGDGQPTLAGRPAVVPSSERAMQGDPSALLPLSLALPVLLGAVIFITWARARWGGWQTWLVGGPILLASLWAVSQTAVQLLPNLI